MLLVMPEYWGSGSTDIRVLASGVIMLAGMMLPGNGTRVFALPRIPPVASNGLYIGIIAPVDVTRLDMLPCRHGSTTTVVRLPGGPIRWSYRSYVKKKNALLRPS